MKSGPNVTPRVLWTLFDKAWENEDVNKMLSIIFWVEERAERVKRRVV